MECNWNIKDLFNEKKKLINIISSEKDINKRKYMELVLESLNDYINGIRGNSFAENLTFNDKLMIVDNELVTLNRHYSLVDMFFDKTFRFMDRIDCLEDKLEYLEKGKLRNIILGNAKISNNRAMTLTDQFYREFAPNLYPIFRYAYNQRQNSVRFVKYLRPENEADSIYFDVIDRYFINIIGGNSISKLFNAIHEYGHVTAAILNPEIRILPEYELFSEVESLFPELVAKYKNIANFDEFSVLMSRYSELVSFIGNATNITCHKPFVNLWKEHNHKANKRYFKDIEEYYDLDKEMVSSALDTQVSMEGDYVVSYLVAIELFDIYKKDQNKALKLYEEFLKLSYNADPYEFFNANLNLGEHIEEYAETLINDVDKQLKKVVS